MKLNASAFDDLLRHSGTSHSFKVRQLWIQDKMNATDVLRKCLKSVSIPH
jgi:hypothetical protein